VRLTKWATIAIMEVPPIAGMSAVARRVFGRDTGDFPMM
jgi:hypothetical protein